MTTEEKIREKLTAALAPTQLIIDDNSYQHRNHKGAKESGGGHFTIEIESSAFEGLTLIKRHQKIYAALGDMMVSEIHALAIKSATAPAQK